MRKILMLCLLCLVCVGAEAQQKTLPSPNVTLTPLLQRGQLLNLSNTYVGARNDTATNTTALYLNVCRISPTTGLPLIYPLYDDGALEIIVQGVKITGTLTATVTLEESFDSTNWAPVNPMLNGPLVSVVNTDTVGTIYINDATYSYASAYTFNATNIAAVQSFTFNLPKRPVAPFLRVKILGTNTQTSSWKSWYMLRIKQQ